MFIRHINPLNVLPAADPVPRHYVFEFRFNIGGPSNALLVDVDLLPRAIWEFPEQFESIIEKAFGHQTARNGGVLVLEHDTADTLLLVVPKVTHLNYRVTI